MKVAIIEDELFAYKELCRMLEKLNPDIQVIAHYDSVSSAVDGLARIQVDLLFFDISLPDGQSFDILKYVDIESPIIFTTAYDEYAIKAFKYNSIDYLLKPVELDELEQALAKFEKSRLAQPSFDYQALASLMHEKKEKKRFLIKIGDKYTYIGIDQVAYFFSEDKVSLIRTFDGATYVIDYTLNEVEGEIGGEFFRVSRNMICALEAIRSTSKYFHSRLKIQLNPAYDQEVLISRARAKEFLAWLDGKY